MSDALHQPTTDDGPDWAARWHVFDVVARRPAEAIT